MRDFRPLAGGGRQVGDDNGDCPAHWRDPAVRVSTGAGENRKRLDLRFQSLPQEIAARHSSLGGEFGEWIDVVKDASTVQSPWIARAGGAGASACCLRRAFFKTPYGILDNIESTSPIMSAVG
jgi:hypothetical protein